MRRWILTCACATLALIGCDGSAPDTDAGVDGGGMVSVDGGEPSTDAGGTDAGGAMDGAAGGDGAVEPLPAIEEFMRQLSDASCRLLVACESKFSIAGPLLQQTCHPSSSFLFEAFADGLAAGTVVYDAEAASRCLDAFAELPCTDVFAPTTLPGCDDVFVPAVPAGGACAGRQECIDGVCEIGASCPGTCVALGGAGTSCSGGDCQDDLICYMGSCEAPHPAGGACADDVDCERGLRCGDEGTCEPLLADGAPCANNFECAGASVCSNGMCGPGAAEGEACETGFTPSVTCQVGLRCDPASETCVPVSLPGEACAANVNCPATFWCDGGTCEPLPALGEPCAGAPGCFRGLCDAGTCRLGREGEPCSSGLSATPATCESGLYCGPGATCAPTLAEGEACVDPAACGAAFDCRDTGTGRVCTPACTSS